MPTRTEIAERLKVLLGVDDVSDDVPLLEDAKSVVTLFTVLFGPMQNHPVTAGDVFKEYLEPKVRD